MSRLIVFFIVGFIGLSLRYIILGKFEWDQLFLLLFFPVGAVLVLFIMKWQYPFGVDSKTEIYHGNSVIATGKRTGNSVYQFGMNDASDQHDSAILFMVYILFNYQFDQ